MSERLIGSVSLSARRAWIEINVLVCSAGLEQSLSARRAWIEILRLITLLKVFSVALRKESVDRNFVPFGVIRPAIGRSPQGERG